MAALSSGQRQAIRAFWSEVISRRRDLFSLSKADLDAAIAATDDWIEANASVYNLALPLAARTNLTAAQKTELFSLVALKRYSG